MQMNGFLYITRRWEEDKGRLSRTLDYLVALKRRTQLLIFPEGTDLTASSKEKSDKFATKNQLPLYNYTLHPKTTGFTYLVRHLQHSGYLDAVYDLTIGYPDYVPQSEIDLVTGKMPKEVHFCVKRISSTDVPKDEIQLRCWLEKRWMLKEEMLKHFAENKCFCPLNEAWPMPNSLSLRIAFGFWTILTGTTVLMLIISPLFQLWTLAHAILFVSLSLFSTGFSQLEMGWYWRWRNISFKTQ